MAYVIHSINSTVNGFCHHLDSVADDEHLQYALSLTLSADALILGRKTFDLFVDFWPCAVQRNELPEHTIALAKAFNMIPKLVMSSNPVNTNWPDTKQVPGPDLGNLSLELQKLKGKAVVFGSPGLSLSLLEAGLVDEIHVVVQPFIGSAGPQMFSELKNRAGLVLIGVDAFDSGAVLLRYKVNK